MNDQTRINTLIDMVSELRQQLATANAALAEKTKEAEQRSKWWLEQSAATTAALAERDEYRRALDDAQQKYDNAMKVVTQ